jgi:hypothetical protein
MSEHELRTQRAPHAPTIHHDQLELLRRLGLIHLPLRATKKEITMNPIQALTTTRLRRRVFLTSGMLALVLSALPLWLLAGIVWGD